MFYRVEQLQFFFERRLVSADRFEYCGLRFLRIAGSDSGRAPRDHHPVPHLTVDKLHRANGLRRAIRITLTETPIPLSAPL
jgi:hypothetical protein